MSQERGRGGPHAGEPGRSIAALEHQVMLTEEGWSHLWADGPDLTDIAVTLQRLEAVREVGAAPFEKLFETNCHGVGELLSEVDHGSVSVVTGPE